MEKDDLDKYIEKMIDERPEFVEILDAAFLARQVIRYLVLGRERSGLTQTQVAKRMQTSQPAVARLERGEADPRLSTVARYARVVGLDLVATERAEAS